MILLFEAIDLIFAQKSAVIKKIKKNFYLIRTVKELQIKTYKTQSFAKQIIRRINNENIKILNFVTIYELLKTYHNEY